MLTFQVEKFQELLKELPRLFVLHYHESALNKQFPISVDWEGYGSYQDRGLLHIVTVRADKKLVGYYFCMVAPHFHYFNSGPMAYTDMYFIEKEFRKGGNGAKLFAEVVRTLKDRGVVKFYASTKVRDDKGPMLERMGFNLTDKIYTKVL
jgi:GNAT superfamily N-acetyltransferase